MMAAPATLVAAAADRRTQAEVDGGRVCGACGQWRAKNEFAPANWAGEKVGSCRPCIKERNRRGRLKARYGLTEQAYDAMFIGQGGACALCKNPPSETALLAALAYVRGNWS